MKIGFACLWGKIPEQSWSGTPWGLRNALRQQAEVVDLGIEYSTVRHLRRYLRLRRRHGRWKPTYQWSSGRDRMIHRKLQASLARSPVDAVVEIGDLARLDAPFYVYQDLSFDILEKYYDSAIGVPGFEGIDLKTIKRRRERQRGIYEAAAGVFAMSEWFAGELVELSGLPPEKVTVVYAGINAVGEITVYPPPGSEEEGRPARLLFVGRDFFRKGGEIVVEALARLRREYSPDMQLTVAGPEKWPLAGGVPEGVVFLGNRSTLEVARLYHTHDVFVMPSRFEAFGIVFREALAHGVPVIGRSAFAMREIITPGQNGTLINGDDPAELAAAVVGVLENPDIRRHTIEAAKDVRRRFSWEAVSGRMLAAMASQKQPR